jgi:hypothetical protein
MVGEAPEGTDFGGAREASAEEREFHARMTNGNRAPPREPGEAVSAGQPEREPQREAPREQRSEATQAPLDLPPPPPTKPFVVWSSSPGDAPPPERRDE